MMIAALIVAIVALPLVIAIANAVLDHVIDEFFWETNDS